MPPRARAPAAAAREESGRQAGRRQPLALPAGTMETPVVDLLMTLYAG